MFHTNMSKKSPHISYSVTLFFFENRAVYEICEKKLNTGGQATDDNMAHYHCMLDTKGYK